MVVTTDDIEQELQEEFERAAKKKKAQSSVDPSWLPDFIPQRCRILLVAGVIFLVGMLFFPGSGQFLSSNYHEPLPGQTSNHLKEEPRSAPHQAPQDSSRAASKQQQVSKPRAVSSGKTVEWVIPITCGKNNKGLNCVETCADQGLQCDINSMKTLTTAAKIKSAVISAGASCADVTKENVAGDWDGPHVKSGSCAYSGNPEWKPSCSLAPHCGWARLCACEKHGEFQGNGPQKFRTSKQAPLMWWDVWARVPKAIQGDWASETMFLDRVLRSFGKMQPGYRGPQKLRGYQYGKIFDDKGMFAMDDSIRSVAIDVGAATNPLPFDLPRDASQVAFFVEPVQWKTIEESTEASFMELQKRGGCAKHFDPGICSLDRALVFPAAVSAELSHASFHVTDNPYCGSLEAFTGSKEIQNSKDPDVKGIFNQCYKDAGRQRTVPTISLKAIIERIPKHISVKYVKIDAQGHDFKVLLSAGDQMSRIEYVRFEMQVDVPLAIKLVKDIPRYHEVKTTLQELGFKHEGKHACFFEEGASRFSKVVKEMECVFCRKLPCMESSRPPLGPHPSAENAKQPYLQPTAWKIPAGMDTRETGEMDTSV